jgi:hypothetical protein
MPAVQQNTKTVRCIGYTTCAFGPGNVRRVVMAKTQYSLTNAKDYFTEHLCIGDYYEEGQRVAGQWFGLGAERLGLAGKVQAKDFLRLCENQHLAIGEPLIQRLDMTHNDGGEEAVSGCESIATAPDCRAISAVRSVEASLTANPCQLSKPCSK